MADEGVLVDHSVKKKLLNGSKLEDVSDIYLYGDIKDGTCRVIGCVACTSSDKVDRESDYLPEGLKICGLFYSTSKFEELDSSRVKQMVKDLLNKKSSTNVNESIVIWQHCQSSKDDYGWLYNINSDCLTKCSLIFSNISTAFLKDRITFRIQSSFDIQVENNLRALRDRLKVISKDLESDSTTFLIKDCNSLLHCCENLSSHSDKTCQDLLNAMTGDQEEGIESPGNRKSKSKRGPSKTTEKTVISLKDAIDVKLMTRITSSENNGFVPVIYMHNEKEHIRHVTVSFPMDVVVIAVKETPVKELPKMFVSAIINQLHEIGNVVQMFSKEFSWCIPRPYHFKLPGYCHIMTVVYPEITTEGTVADDKYLESYRINLHKKFLLPLNRPLLRVCNSYIFHKDRKPEPYLINPHTGISTSGDGTIGLVYGYYSYHHYMQDNFNDDKWGCAYRSLQTICSWFRHQGYTSKLVPSHREIQQALVDIGDKQSNFVGSKQWIGSFEVSMCLEHLLGVTSKIMFVNSGAEMASKGRELLHHFETQGTPIMIGGGVLAHTIIGVDFDLQSGDIKFLILDPHYTGSEDLKAILDKGWCGWKGPNFWNQQAHYNMCMPQRPDII